MMDKHAKFGLGHTHLDNCKLATTIHTPRIMMLFQNIFLIKRLEVLLHNNLLQLRMAIQTSGPVQSVLFVCMVCRTKCPACKRCEVNAVGARILSPWVLQV